MLNLRDIFKDLNGLTFIGLTALTTPKLTGGKKNEHQGRITKKSKVSGMSYTNTNTNTYLNLVRKEIPDFKLSERKWGSRVTGLPIVEHKGTDYLEVIIQSVSKTEYFLDGKLIDKADIIGLVKPRPAHGVVIRDYKADSIIELRHNKQVFLM